MLPLEGVRVLAAEQYGAGPPFGTLWQQALIALVGVRRLRKSDRRPEPATGAVLQC